MHLHFLKAHALDSLHIGGHAHHIGVESHRKIEMQVNERHLFEWRGVVNRLRSREFGRFHSMECHIDRRTAGLTTKSDRLDITVRHTNTARDVSAAGLALDGHVDVHNVLTVTIGVERYFITPGFRMSLVGFWGVKRTMWTSRISG